MITIMDARIGYPVEVDSMPTVCNGFIYWRGENREVCEIHRTGKGTQIELIA